MFFRDRLGWAIERIRGRYITNALRLLIHTNIRQTWKHRKSESPMPPVLAKMLTNDLNPPQTSKRVWMETYSDTLRGLAARLDEDFNKNRDFVGIQLVKIALEFHNSRNTSIEDRLRTIELKQVTSNP